MLRSRKVQEHANDAKYLAEVLAAIGQTERAIATQGLGFFKDKQFGWRIRPLQRLNPDWFFQTAMQSIEVRLAASLAAIPSVIKQRRILIGSTRHFLEPVETSKWIHWTKSTDLKTSSAVWSARRLDDNLAAVFLRRQMEAFRQGLKDVPLHSPIPARLDDVIDFLNGKTNDEKLGDLLWAFIGLDWSKVPWQKPLKPRNPIPAEFGIVRLLVRHQSYRPKKVSRLIPTKNQTESRIIWCVTKTRERTTIPDPSVFQHLASGRETAIADCVDAAARRLKSGGLLVTGYRNRQQAGRGVKVTSPIPAIRLLASMLFPLSDPDLARIANAVLYPPETEE